MNYDVQCPYCEAYEEINHDDGYGYEEDVTHQQQCSSCNKYYTYTTSISYYYEANKADCLNDGEHTWKPSRTWPKEATKMICVYCDERREPTEEEWKNILT